ncbi:GbsR/MarR family transcriptional regulator [Streptomyces morookaense]|uniref:Helix-turn-helix domain-containing protein n=1 Tax=Streptomyces morookaense TaxID=1970 RepID=A0A7Y7B4Z4_STRMO|nr:MarR family transcriptional regulator [Streptomyces morookaense]NVK79100.1 helix-turn-helix domain-containing protein [Streptomyces morookaense]GHF10325.1 MarR family transcriptional regulator [Streptomyces morookaense]
MPGGRLTHDDRRRIAEGLAEGLTYAGIARRLGRPTSTVSREVSRNGGPDGYRADHAHLATARRARRGAPPADRPAAATASGGFEERLTAALISTGVPRMTARVLACLCGTDTRGLTSADLVRRLQVSPASVSHAIAYLEAQELVRRERDPGQRYERYVVGDDVWYRSLLASVRTNALLADALQEGAETLGPTTPAGARLAEMSEFLNHLGADLIKKAEAWPRKGRWGHPHR